MVQTARDEQQRRTVVIIEVNGSSGVGVEVGKGGFKKSMVRPGNGITIEGRQRLFFA